MTTKELLEKYYDIEMNNVFCYSATYLMDSPKKRYERELQICGMVYNIAKKQDTSRDYICPACTRKRRKQRVSQKQNDNGAGRKAYSGMAPERSGGQRAESRPEGQD